MTKQRQKNWILAVCEKHGASKDGSTFCFHNFLVLSNCLNISMFESINYGFHRILCSMCTTEILQKLGYNYQN